PARSVWSPLSRKGGSGMGEGPGVRASTDRCTEGVGTGVPESAPEIGVRWTAYGGGADAAAAPSPPGLKPWARCPCPSGAAKNDDGSARFPSDGLGTDKDPATGTEAAVDCGVPTPGLESGRAGALSAIGEDTGLITS